jgi:hypothetical protein
MTRGTEREMSIDVGLHLQALNEEVSVVSHAIARLRNFSHQRIIHKLAVRFKTFGNHLFSCRQCSKYDR